MSAEPISPGILVFSSCTAAKDDSVPVDGRTVEPAGYLDDDGLLRRMADVRQTIFSDSRASVGTTLTYAFDLYFRKGRMYSTAFNESYDRLRTGLRDKTLPIPVEWFFLSGGYGLVHALEPAHTYQATFSYGIARQNNIPHTRKIWGRTLVDICRRVIDFHPAWPVVVFGSPDYLNFIQETARPARFVESRGQAGSLQIAPVIGKFVNSLLDGRMEMP